MKTKERDRWQRTPCECLGHYVPSWPPYFPLRGYRAGDLACQDNKPVLFPIRLDDAVMHTDEAWAADVRRTGHIGDFTRWKDHDAYQQVIQRLLRDLKAEAESSK